MSGAELDYRSEPYIEGLDSPAPPIVSGDVEGQRKQYRYVFDDDTGLIVRFEHKLSPQVEEIIERAKRPAKFAAAGVVAGIVIGAILFGLVALNAMGDDEEA